LFVIGFWLSFHLVEAQEILSETEKLAATGKVWGFLKYYHPEVAKGKYNWDKELFRVLPLVRNANTKEDLSQVFLDWIETNHSRNPGRQGRSIGKSNMAD